MSSKKNTRAAAAASVGNDETGQQPTTSSSARPGTTPLTLAQKREALLGKGAGGSSALAQLLSPNAAPSSLSLRPNTNTGGTRVPHQEPTEQVDSDQNGEDDGEGVRPQTAAPRASKRGGTANDQHQIRAILQQMQDQVKQQMEFMRQQMQLSRDEHAEERRREREENEARLRVMEERFAVLAVPRLTAAANDQTTATAQERKVQGSPNMKQSRPSTKDAIPQTPARVSTPASRPALQPERPAPGDDGDDGDGGDGPAGPPLSARKGLRPGDATAQPAMVSWQRSSLPLPNVDRLCQADLVQNGRVLLKWRREIEDQIETAEFNSGGGPFSYEKRFFMARHTMDEGVREFINAYQCEAKAGRGQKLRTWEQLIHALEKHYAPARDAEEAAREFYSGKMEADETMEQFVHRIGAVINRIPKEDLPSNTATEVVLLMIDDKKFPGTLRILRDEQRKHKLDYGGRGMEFLTLRNKLPELARAEPNQDLLADLEAWKADIMLQLAEGGLATEEEKQEKDQEEPTEPNGPAESDEEIHEVIQKLNVIQFGSFMALTDEELKKRRWSDKKIEALRSNGCFRCFRKGHQARDCKAPRA
jgi:hypothetical protein